MVSVGHSRALPRKAGPTGRCHRNLSFIKRVNMKKVRNVQLQDCWRRYFLLGVMLFSSIAVFAQDGNAGINEANTKVRSYFASGTNLMYAVGAIVGLIGAVKV